MITGRINQVHCGLFRCMLNQEREREGEKREREREREKGQKEEEERGRRPTRGERERKDMETCVLLPPVQVAGVRRPASRRQEGGEKAPRPATRKEEKEKEEGGRERAKKPRNPETRPQRKNPRRSLPQNLAKTLYPNNKSWPLKAHQ